MATETPRPPLADDAAPLDDLRADRRNLATRLDGPRWFAPGMGLVAAAVVAGPAIPDGSGRITLLMGALAASIALLSTYHRTTGVKLGGVGAQARLIYAAILVITLVLLSVSFGLAAGGLHWWITLSALTAFALTTWLVGRFVSAAGDHISHGL